MQPLPSLLAYLSVICMIAAPHKPSCFFANLWLCSSLGKRPRTWKLLAQIWTTDNTEDTWLLSSLTYSGHLCHLPLQGSEDIGKRWKECKSWRIGTAAANWCLLDRTWLLTPDITGLLLSAQDGIYPHFIMDERGTPEAPPHPKEWLEVMVAGEGRGVSLQ